MMQNFYMVNYNQTTFYNNIQITFYDKSNNFVIQTYKKNNNGNNYSNIFNETIMSKNI